MDIYFQNTLSGKKEPFVPMDPNRITIYVCGPTVYNYVHIGNGRPAVVFDVLVRLLKSKYPNVVHAANVTDIDDKINAAAAAAGEPISALADRYTEAYLEDVAALGVEPADLVPRATHHIDEIIDMINALIEHDHAYANEGHVLFNVPSDKRYGELSRRSLEDMLHGARVDVAPYKKDPKDFVLWKPSDDSLPGWDSPWGRGRPGWHIECSAMIKKHLGTTIDIHGGGSDLTFPHHENEAAQSRCANQNPEYVRYWLHNGMLTLSDEKMSKSLGNIKTIRELLKQHSGETLRYALLLGQYRSSLAWSPALIQQAEASLDRLYQALRDQPGADPDVDFATYGFEQFPQSVVSALCDDINTPVALAALHELAGELRRADSPEAVNAARAALLAGGWLLGVLTEDAESHFRGAGSEGDLSDADIDALIEKRNQARKDGDYALADSVRDELANAGIELEDTREGTRWRRA